MQLPFLDAKYVARVWHFPKNSFKLGALLLQQTSNKHLPGKIGAASIELSLLLAIKNLAVKPDTGTQTLLCRVSNRHE